METVEIAVIGAGLAGAAVAFRLAERGCREILVLEQEEIPGVHSSGRNAAIIRRLTPDASVSSLARRGAAFIADPPEDWENRPEFRRCGLLLVGEERDLESLQESTGKTTCEALGITRWTRERCAERVPLLQRARIEGGLWCPQDGVVDVAALLQGYLHEARRRGAVLRTRSTVTGVEAKPGEATALRLADGAVIRARTVVNAAGAWATEIARRAGALDIPVRPHRRHLFATTPLPSVDPAWPAVWEVTEDAYFRPESAGLLLSPCDEELHPPGIPPADPAATAELHRKLTLLFPAVGDPPILRQWAGLRTFTPDRRFVIGPDPLVPGFFWVAGLGGHGVTTSAAVGELAARMILGERPLEAWHFSPERFG